MFPLREHSDAYREHVAGRDLDEADLHALMAHYPELANRPFVASEKGVLLCRPPERVYELV
ncbi:ArsC/Spx/MgsR family protein [Conchiformibius kuhniae]|uniref:ArsC/Spx/MgsR family protein n=1 Tax=Conchiformibius kuhniae TaxID=211502 RepID=UPI000A02F188